MNLPFTMSPSEAADCVKAFKPKIVFPYHYQGQKPEEFAAALSGAGIDVRLLNWYPTVPREDVVVVARPGALVDVGGRGLHMNCTGRGSPTVVLETPVQIDDRDRARADGGDDGEHAHIGQVAHGGLKWRPSAGQSSADRTDGEKRTRFAIHHARGEARAPLDEREPADRCEPLRSAPVL
jgi:hypothetical protein